MKIFKSKLFLFSFVSILLCLPCKLVFATIYRADVFSDVRLYTDGSSLSYINFNTATDTDSYDVYVSSLYTGVVKLGSDGMTGPNTYEYSTRISADPSLFNLFEIDYKFWIDSGDPTDSFFYTQAPNRLAPMGFASDAVITAGVNPTISWSSVENADLYKIRFYTEIGTYWLESYNVAVDGSDYYSFNYTGDLFNNYNRLFITIEARDYDGLYIGAVDLQNLSRTYYEHSATAPVPEPSTILLMASGLVGLAGFGRKRFRKKLSE